MGRFTPEKVDDSNRNIEDFQQDIRRSQPRNRDWTPAQIVWTTENLDTSEIKWWNRDLAIGTEKQAVFFCSGQNGLNFSGTDQLGPRYPRWWVPNDSLHQKLSVILNGPRQISSRPTSPTSPTPRYSVSVHFISFPHLQNRLKRQLKNISRLVGKQKWSEKNVV